MEAGDEANAGVDGKSEMVVKGRIRRVNVVSRSSVGMMRIPARESGDLS
jgi:hypothetical protein